MVLVFYGRHSSKLLRDDNAATLRVLHSLGGNLFYLRQPKKHASFTLSLVVFTANGRWERGIQEKEWKRCAVDVATAPITMHEPRHHCLSCSDSSPLISSSWRHGAGHQTTYLPSWHLATMPEGFLNHLWGPSLEGSKFFNQSLEFFEVAVGHKPDGVSFEDMRWTEVYRGSSW